MVFDRRVIAHDPSKIDVVHDHLLCVGREVNGEVIDPSLSDDSPICEFNVCGEILIVGTIEILYAEDVLEGDLNGLVGQRF